jgi:hypothetical protein
MMRFPQALVCAAAVVVVATPAIRPISAQTIDSNLIEAAKKEGEIVVIQDRLRKFRSVDVDRRFQDVGIGGGDRLMLASPARSALVPLAISLQGGRVTGRFAVDGFWSTEKTSAFWRRANSCEAQ